MDNLLSNKQKAWAGFVIGFLSQAITIVAAALTEGQLKVSLITVGAVIGTLGVMLGVYQTTNTPRGS